MSHEYQKYNAGSFLIYIDSYDNSIPKGQYYHPYRGDAGRFQSLVQLLLKIEQCMDVDDLPQSFQAVRTFFPLQGGWEDGYEEILPRMGNLATFSLQVIFRRNASWQGSVTWLEGKQTQHFRSVLELIALMDSAIAARQMSPQFLGESAPLLELAE